MELRWRADNDGFLFQVAPSAAPWAHWASVVLHLPDGRDAHVGPLLRRIEEGSAVAASGDTILLTHEAVATLEPRELRMVGLPERVPFSLSLSSRGTIADSNFSIAYTFNRSDGAPVVSPTQIGALLSVGNEQFVLGEPLFSILAKVHAINEASSASIDVRMLAWSELRELMNDDTSLDTYLGSMRIATADAFKLRPFINELGEPDIDPILGFGVYETTGDSEEPALTGLRESLPPARQEDFATRFRSRGKAAGRYALGGAWYVVLPKPLGRALEIVHKAQRSAPTERRAFVANPRAFLREALDAEYDEVAIEALLWDEGYSERVREVGVWTPKVLPWLQRSSGQTWLPPEEVGLRIGDALVSIDKSDVDHLINRVTQAIEEGKPVAYRSTTIPATPATLEALKRIASEITRRTAPPSQPQPPEKRERIALLVKDNLEELQYRRQRRIQEQTFDGEVPTLRSRLLPHQKDGLAWLQEHWAAGNPGALLSDDMGLGKTVQALAFLSWVQRVTPNGGPILVVAPTGLLKNWMDEHDLHLEAPGLGVATQAFGGGLRSLRTTRGTKELSAGLPVLDVPQLERSNWVLASFETVRDYQHSFGRIHWQVICLDEAQKIKNPEAAMTDAAKALKADFVLAMTGTPVENRMADLWSIVDTVWPGRLGALRDFVKRHEEVTSDDEEEALRTLRAEMLEKDPPPLMKRRLKQDHLEGLPEKLEHMLKIPMPPAQASAYERAVQSASSEAGNPGGILKVLHALRRLSLHPLSLEECDDDRAYVEKSARLHACFQVLDEICERGQKALVFTEFRDAQGALGELLQRRYQLDVPPLLINGAVSGERRKDKVDEFQQRRGFDVMILSPRAGGVGLTLTAANHVIHLSRWWNPAVEDQCTDRVFRIGQTKPVHVYYPLAVHPVYGDASFDIQLDELMARKRALSRSVLAPPSFTDDDAANLFRSTVPGGNL